MDLWNTSSFAGVAILPLTCNAHNLDRHLKGKGKMSRREVSQIMQLRYRPGLCPVRFAIKKCFGLSSECCGVDI